MCGIVGYVGHRPALGVVVEALRRMEYRGYDSSGIAILDGTGGVEIERKAGKLANLEAELGEYGADHFVGTSGMGHTRWATHGRPTDRNAHPHRDASGKLAVVHNGIIENFAPLRAELEAAGVELQSDTDSEVAVHLSPGRTPRGRRQVISSRVRCRWFVGWKVRSRSFSRTLIMRTRLSPRAARHRS